MSEPQEPWYVTRLHNLFSRLWGSKRLRPFAVLLGGLLITLGVATGSLVAFPELRARMFAKASDFPEKESLAQGGTDPQSTTGGHIFSSPSPVPALPVKNFYEGIDIKTDETFRESELDVKVDGNLLPFDLSVTQVSGHIVTIRPPGGAWTAGSHVVTLLCKQRQLDVDVAFVCEWRISTSDDRCMENVRSICATSGDVSMDNSRITLKTSGSRMSSPASIEFYKAFTASTDYEVDVQLEEIDRSEGAIQIAMPSQVSLQLHDGSPSSVTAKVGLKYTDADGWPSKSYRREATIQRADLGSLDGWYRLTFRGGNLALWKGLDSTRHLATMPVSLGAVTSSERNLAIRTYGPAINVLGIRIKALPAG